MGIALKAWTLLATWVCGATVGAVVGAIEPKWSTPLGFTFNGVSNKVITPNGDGRNDNVAFRFDNPRDVAGTIRIYDSRGHLVATLAINPGDLKEVWDATSGGNIVATGVYIYVITVDGATTSGAVAVIR